MFYREREREREREKEREKCNMWVLDGDKKLVLFIYKPKERTKLNKELNN